MIDPHGQDRLGGGRRAARRAAPAPSLPQAPAAAVATAAVRVARLPCRVVPGGTTGGFTPREKLERPADKAVRQANLRRIGRLFRPYWAKLSVVTFLIVFASALGVIPAFLQQAVFSQAFTPTGIHDKYVTVDLQLLAGLVLAMIAISLVNGDLRRLPVLSLDPGRPERDARPAHLRLPPPAAAVARVLHEDPHRRGAEPDRERHRRRRQRPHLDRDLGHVDRDDRDRDGDRDVPARVAARDLRARR